MTAAATAPARFVVEVTHTDRSRHPDGSFVEFTAVVEVLAAGAVEAKLVAAQMVGAVRARLDGMVLGARVLSPAARPGGG